MSGRTLLVGPAWIGDLVMAHSLVRLLIERQPAVAVDLLVPASTAALGARLPGVDRVLQLDVAHGELALGRRRQFGRTLRDQGYTQAIVLPNSFKSALVPWWARIPRRTGWLGEQRYALLNDIRRQPAQHARMVERFVALGLEPGAALPRALPLPRVTADAARGMALTRQLGLTLDAPLLVLCPGAEYGIAKRWPAAHFAAVATHWVARGGEVWLLGSPAEAPIGAAMRAALSPAVAAAVHDLIGRTDLLAAVDLLALAARVVTNDSGLMHVAAALGRPVIGVFGSTSPTLTPPLAPDAEALTLALECSPCFARECPLGHLRCLRELGPEQVIARVGAPH
jgi:heptosyltransferase II